MKRGKNRKLLLREKKKKENNTIVTHCSLQLCKQKKKSWANKKRRVNDADKNKAEKHAWVLHNEKGKKSVRAHENGV